SGAFADATIDSVANSADARACRWAGFAPESTYVSSGDTSIAVGDFNGDGHPDVVVTAWGNGTPSTAASGAVRASVFLNQGNGAFAPAASYNTDMEATSVAVGDFNGDGKPDFAVLTVLDQIDLFVNQGD